jgi:hypothetical protein
VNAKVFRFSICLLALTLAYGLYRLMIEDSDNVSLFIRQICNTLYLFTPALAVLIVEKWKIKEIVSSYRLTVSGMNVKRGIQYVLATAFAVPLLILAFTYILGNVSGSTCFGGIITSVSSFNGIALSGNTCLRIGVLYLISVGFALLCGLSFQLLFALGGEIAWRGFLETHLAFSSVPKTLLTGLFWGIWNIPFITGAKDASTFLLSFGTVLLFCIVCSFYFSRALKQTHTLFVPAAMQGVITSLSLTFLTGGDHVNYLLAGTHGLLAVISIACVHVIFTKPVKFKNI